MLSLRKEEKVMTATMTSKGQITIPKEVRDRMGIQQGDKIEFVEEDGKTVLRRAQPAENPFLKWAGICGSLPDGVTAKEYVRELRGWDDWDREHFG
jgi:antitoxin PrlF